MTQDKPTQLTLFSVGEGENRQKTDSERTTDALLSEGQRLYQLCFTARSEYNRMVVQKEAYEKAVKNVGKDRWVYVDGQRMPTAFAKSVVKFLKSFEFEQCSRIERIKAIIAAVNARGAAIEFSSSDILEGNC